MRGMMKTAVAGVTWWKTCMMKEVGWLFHIK
jgi:hypothetical protein